MIKIYSFEYNSYEASCAFRVDTDKFTVQHAMATLDFFDWRYNKEADPIDEVMKKYAITAIRIATFNNYNLFGVIKEFKDYEGYGSVDGSIGLTLIAIEPYEFDADNLEMKIS